MLIDMDNIMDMAENIRIERNEAIQNPQVGDVWKSSLYSSIGLVIIAVDEENVSFVSFMEDEREIYRATREQFVSVFHEMEAFIRMNVWRNDGVPDWAVRVSELLEGTVPENWEGPSERLTK